MIFAEEWNKLASSSTGGLPQMPLDADGFIRPPPRVMFMGLGTGVGMVDMRAWWEVWNVQTPMKTRIR